ncbi:MAG: RES domain-containing protein [Pirellulales bacterium]|nr:RES domain-containing protein [Pirellulales bacterium]
MLRVRRRRDARAGVGSHGERDAPGCWHHAGADLGGLEADPLLPPLPPPRLQSIGNWISKGHGNFSAILYPSRRRRAGRNLVIFRNRLNPGDAVIPRSQQPTKSWP